MKKTIFLCMVLGWILGSGMVGFAQMRGMMGPGMMPSEGRGMAPGHYMYMPMMYGMPMGDMMGGRMIATEDGGVILISAGKLYKFDKDLNLKKEADIPVDFEHMKKMYEQMRNTYMMEEKVKGSQGSNP
jgi:hypothetical protein